MNKSKAFLVAGAAAAGVIISRRLNARSLSGKVVLLTGGSRGLGLQLARQLATESCKLILVARNADELASAAGDLKGSGAIVETLVCDLTNQVELSRMLLQAEALFGRVDIVVNDAGRIDVGPVDLLTEEDFQAAMDLMFWAPVRICLGLLPSLLRSGDADIVNISSIGGRIAVPHLLPYSSAKFALCGFSEGLDAEVRNRGVRVLTVTPGLMRTGSHKQAQFSGKQTQEYSWFAMGATVPGVSMEVGRAARQIVHALRRKRRSLTLTWSAQVAVRLHGAFPETSLMVANVINQFLPKPNGDTYKQRGADLQNTPPAAIRAVVSLGETAARTQHENT